MSLQVDIRKTLGRFTLDVHLEAGDEPVALLGASGSGKSMTLKCIAGIERPDEGRIVLDGITLFDSARKIALPPQKRRVGLLFQSYALFPNMTVAQNVRAGLGASLKKDERRERVQTLLDAFYLNGLENRLPSQLSGGQQQRVALARILLSEPRILMLDEPFSALDSYLRWQLEQTMADVISSFGGTTLLVSHNRDEAYHLCDKIAVIAGGRVDAFGTRDALFRAPQTRQAALLTGCKNISSARSEGEDAVFAPGWNLTLAIGCRLTEPVQAVGIRAHYFGLGEGPNAFDCTVERVIESPFSMVFMVWPDGASEQIRWETEDKTLEIARGNRIRLHIAPEKVLCLR
ncbi:MAG: sulfate/molybdate ABC transporter ATP-binding protein [Intestinibacillus sp.]